MKNGLTYGFTALAILVLDQVTKIVALNLFTDKTVEVLPFFNFVLVWNRGVSFGMLTEHGSANPLILVALSLVIVAGLLIWLVKTQSKPLGIALCFVIAGALGNVIDRVRFGAVVDFLDFHAFGYHWPAFNIADCAIVLGIAFLAIDGLFFEAKRHKDETSHEKQSV